MFAGRLTTFAPCCLEFCVCPRADSIGSSRSAQQVDGCRPHIEPRLDQALGVLPSNLINCVTVRRVTVAMGDSFAVAKRGEPRRNRQAASEVRERQQWVGTVRLAGGRAVVDVAQSRILGPTTAALRIAAARASDSHGTGRRLAGAYREHTGRRRPAPHAASLPVHCRRGLPDLNGGGWACRVDPRYHAVG